MCMHGLCMETVAILCLMSTSLFGDIWQADYITFEARIGSHDVLDSE
jgi:hypothetical protein